MNKPEFIEHLAEKTGQSKKTVSEFLRAFDDIVVEAASAGQHVRIGIGTFRPATRVARTAHNPVTGKPIDVPARRTLTFKARKGVLK